MEEDREKFTTEVPLEDPSRAEPGIKGLTPGQTQRINELADKPEELLAYIKQLQAGRQEPEC